MKVIITFTFCCDHPWKSKCMALEKPGKLRELFSTLWLTSTIKKDLDLLGLTCYEALDLTKDRSEWRDCTARCAFTARVRTKV